MPVRLHTITETSEAMAHIWKQPWHLTSMKNELGLCTSRFSLWDRFSSSAGGCKRSMSECNTCVADVASEYVQVDAVEGAAALEPGNAHHLGSAAALLRTCKPKRESWVGQRICIVLHVPNAMSDRRILHSPLH
jgi:hypothetical protein